MQEGPGHDVASQASRTETPPSQRSGKPARRWPRLPGLGRLLAYSRREILELRRDPIRLGICFLAPVLLLVVLGYGISLDVEDLPYAVLDRDRTPESRTYLENYAGSRYFEERPLLASYADLERRLRSGELRLAIEIPANFGRDLIRGDVPTVGVWIDGGMPFRAETTRGYLLGIERAYTRDLVRRNFGSDFDALPANLVTRFRYNQDLKSVFAIVPGIIALILVLVPTMLMAVTVVREKELGSITNLYATPVTRFEFLLGKQLPYIAVSFVSFLMLVALTIFLFQVPLKGSFAALAIGAVLYVWAATAFGLLVSAFTRTQVAAVLAATILTILPTVQFSGLITPVSSLTGAAAAMGRGFPAAYFNSISVGTFTKALGFGDLLLNYAVLLGFILAFTLLSLVLLRKQEA